jgi:oxygen-independent coproporphyrinogen-3 oxidase
MLEEGKLPLGRGHVTTPHGRLIRELILLLKRGYLEADYFQDKFGVDVLDKWREVWDDHQRQGYVQISDRRVELTRAGLLRADGLLPSFFEPEHRDVRYT